MNEEMLAARVRDAVEEIGVPAYPAAVVARRVAQTIPARSARPRLRPATAFASLAVAVAIAIGATAAAQSPGVTERMRAILAGMGVPMKNARIVVGRTVTLDEARAAVSFPIVVPSGVPLVRTTLTEDPKTGYTSVGLILRYGERSQIALDESPARDARRKYEFEGGVNLSRRGAAERRLVTVLSWRVGGTRLVMVPYDAASRAFAKQVRSITRGDGG